MSPSALGLLFELNPNSLGFIAAQALPVPARADVHQGLVSWTAGGWEADLWVGGMAESRRGSCVSGLHGPRQEGCSQAALIV